MKRMSFLFVVMILCSMVISGCASEKQQPATEKQTDPVIVTEAVTEAAETEGISESDYIEHVKSEVEKNDIVLTYPDDSEWMVVEFVGMITASVTATNDKGENCIVSAWLEIDNSVIHYLDTKYGVLIDDGVIED